MPAIDIGALSLFIGREDREGDDGSGITTEDNDNTDVEAGGYARNFLEVVLRRLWEGHFGRRRTTKKTTETSRDDEHEEDAVTRSMFETLCEGESSSSSFTARLKRHRWRRPRRGRAGRICRGRKDHGRGEADGNDGMGDASVTTTTTNDYHDETCTIAQQFNT